MDFFLGSVGPTCGWAFHFPPLSVHNTIQARSVGPITHASNRSINEGVFPRAWKTAIVTLFTKQVIQLANHSTVTGLSFKTGAPQGSVLEPLVFSFNINDLTNMCIESILQMYADNTLMYVHATRNQQAASMLDDCSDGQWWSHSALITPKHKENSSQCLCCRWV